MYILATTCVYLQVQMPGYNRPHATRPTDKTTQYQSHFIHVMSDCEQFHILPIATVSKFSPYALCTHLHYRLRCFWPASVSMRCILYIMYQLPCTVSRYWDNS